MTPKFWTYKNWEIEKDMSGNFWVAPLGSRKKLVKNVFTLAKAKSVVTARIKKQKEFESILAQHNVKTFDDLDNLKVNGESRHSVMCRLFGERTANELLHVLSIQVCTKRI